MMGYFKKDTLIFLKELIENNNKEWFQENKNRFKNSVENPFKKFIEDLIPKLEPYIYNLNVTEKDCVFRIYKDVRFNKDKTPYKTHLSALINHNGKKNKTTPGLYLEISSDYVRLYSGCFELSSYQKELIRDYISLNMEVFNDLINDKIFVDTYGEIRGEKDKKISSKYSALIKVQPLILNNSFYYFTEYQANLVLSNNFMEILLNDFKKTLRLNDFFNSILL